MAYNKETGMYEGYIYKIYNDVNDKLYIGQTTVTIGNRWHGHMTAALNEKRSKSALYNAMRKYGRDKFHIEQIDKIEHLNKEDLINSLNILEQQRIIEYKSHVSENGYNFEKGGDNKKVPGRTVCKYDLNLNYLDTYISTEEAGRQNNIDGSTIYGCCTHNFYTAGGYVWAFEGDNPIKPKPKFKWYDGRKIFQYNSYMELINTFENIFEAMEKLHITSNELRLNLEGEKLSFKKTVLRYEDEPFDKYPRSMCLQPVTLYDLQGNFVANFETKKDAEDFLNVPSGEITKVLKRGGSCKGYLISNYGEHLQRKLYRCEVSVLMCDENFNIIKDFSSMKEVADYFKINDCHKQIKRAIKNKNEYRGYHWKYKEEFKLTV